MTNDSRNEDKTSEEGARPSSLIPVHKLATPDRLYDLQLLRDLAIVNDRTVRELGPMPPGGLPVIPKRKPKSWRHDVSSENVNRESEEDETMKLSRVAMAAALGVATIGSVPAHGSDSTPTETKAAISAHYITPPPGHDPDWPKSGIAERELGDGVNTYPQNMFVEYAKGRWHVWVIMTNLHGPAKALDFFSGKLLENVKVNNPGDYNDAFVDAQGVTHKSVIHPAFDYKDPRPGGGLGEISFSGESLSFDGDVKCAPLSLDVSQRMTSDNKTVIWSKMPLYKTNPWPEACPDGVWNSLVNTALDLRDGTMLITGNKYIFRIHQADMTPAGSAPHLHVVDEAEVKRAIEQAKNKDIGDANVYLTEQLHLH
ncbi:MAG: hypothetical protein WA777_11155 [Rhodanobacter sp.]